MLAGPSPVSLQETCDVAKGSCSFIMKPSRALLPDGVSNLLGKKKKVTKRDKNVGAARRVEADKRRPQEQLEAKASVQLAHASKVRA
jgi:hypothetical protein